jgi:hypothetical protein
MRCIMGLLLSAGNSMYICASGISIYAILLSPSTIMLILPPKGPLWCWVVSDMSTRILGSDMKNLPFIFALPLDEVVDMSAEKGCGIWAIAKEVNKNKTPTASVPESLCFTVFSPKLSVKAFLYTKFIHWQWVGTEPMTDMQRLYRRAIYAVNAGVYEHANQF